MLASAIIGRQRLACVSELRVASRSGGQPVHRIVAWLITGATTATGVVVIGHLGVLVLGCIAVLVLLLISFLALVAVFGSEQRQVRAERILGMLLNWMGRSSIDADDKGISAGEAQSPPGLEEGPLKRLQRKLRRGGKPG
jgi:hypothetical protein